ncbi:hypothetical protein PR002_g24507 [Phytophthora rubi]|uniref:Uncharacterized protein n=1 Tax=Phytophthora rubi TaxID=129364 RepID=A0A6A3IG58_9STRA|nr:hypothetical protein PR002_g24507 [Phytophthora rubi]
MKWLFHSLTIHGVGASRWPYGSTKMATPPLRFVDGDQKDRSVACVSLLNPHDLACWSLLWPTSSGSTCVSCRNTTSCRPCESACRNERKKSAWWASLAPKPLTLSVTPLNVRSRW